MVNLGDYRRKKSTYHDHSIFNPNNEEGLRIRNQVFQTEILFFKKYIREITIIFL